MKNIAEGTIHIAPDDLKKILNSHQILLEKWNSLTALARNEWICWITSAKKQETREKRIEKFSEEIISGKRRPCCWPGCPHHNPNTTKWFNHKQRPDTKK
ncbi:MAG: hypothetical protein D6735_02575 [Acidobacteria bacterium]|jgi:uncharacterized protein YdeI (YjbR/CyaY-like superfamily)|nr:MAG: hypothetical protein D6735_02575 [Acidobacteriota bacterium]